MKFKSNERQDSSEYVLRRFINNVPSMQNYLTKLDRNYRHGVSFDNYFDSKKEVCLICGMKCEKKTSESGDRKYLVSKLENEKQVLHRVWSKNKKRMFCRIADGSLKIAFGISKQDPNPQILEVSKGSRKHDKIEKIKIGLEWLSEEEIKKLDIPQSLTSLNTIKLSEILDKIKEKI